MSASDLGQVDHEVWESYVPTSPESEAWDGTLSHTLGLAEGGSVDHHRVAHEAVSALHGLGQDPDHAIALFEHVFGPGSLEGLRHTIFGGQEENPDEPQTEGLIEDDSDGMADQVPVDGPRGPASIAMAGGEYVMPADCVADLGSGNTAAGAKVLDELVSYIRQMRHGTSDQPPQVDGKGLVLNFVKHGGGE